jgi:hypothetical protein
MLDRDEVALRAMTAMLQGDPNAIRAAFQQGRVGDFARWTAGFAYSLADAMVAARAQGLPCLAQDGSAAIDLRTGTCARCGRASPQNCPEKEKAR